MNFATLSGMLVQDPELRYTSSDQTPVSSTLLEFTERTKDEAKSVIKVIAYGKSADALQKFRSGMQVALEGSIRMNKIERPDGIKETRPEFYMNRVESFGAPVAQANTSKAEDSDDDDCPFD